MCLGTCFSPYVHTGHHIPPQTIPTLENDLFVLIHVLPSVAPRLNPRAGQIASDLSNDPVARYADAVPVKKSSKAAATKGGFGAGMAAGFGKRASAHGRDECGVKAPHGGSFT